MRPAGSARPREGRRAIAGRGRGGCLPAIILGLSERRGPADGEGPCEARGGREGNAMAPDAPLMKEWGASSHINFSK